MTLGLSPFLVWILQLLSAARSERPSAGDATHVIVAGHPQCVTGGCSSFSHVTLAHQHLEIGTLPTASLKRVRNPHWKLLPLSVFSLSFTGQNWSH